MIAVPMGAIAAIGNKRNAAWAYPTEHTLRTKAPRLSHSNNESSSTPGRPVPNNDNLPIVEAFGTKDIVATALSFVADADVPTELLKTSMTSKSFRAAALSSIIWKELCDSKWKTKFGYQRRMEQAEKVAQTEGNQDNLSSTQPPSIRSYPPSLIKAESWYHLYWNEMKLSALVQIDLLELQAFPWSGCRWFRRPMHKYPAHLPSGIKKPVSNSIRFGEDCVVRGGDRECLYNLEGEGTIVNTSGFSGEECPVRTLHVHRLENWGWELRSQYFVCRSIDENGPEGLWADYKKALVVQFKGEEEVSGREGGEIIKSRRVPRSLETELRW
mmetsp:Transcript_7101/g.17016  ORF Transcript_7101/g.17016 Transcript_7101/m.17016 type:complete len:328 (-) Transcript_7101:158-1141(-)